jgi:hypothetical protein
MMKLNCDVIFYWFIPQDLISCPYVIITSHEIHKHTPPPPQGIPIQILHDLQNIIKMQIHPNLTTSMCQAA